MKTTTCILTAAALLTAASLINTTYIAKHPSSASTTNHIISPTESLTIDADPIEETQPEKLLSHQISDVPYVSQEGLPTGCEIASAVMLMQNLGVDITLESFADNGISTCDLVESGDVLCGKSPYDAFIGDPYSPHGYGCYAPVIQAAIERMADADITVYDLMGTLFSQLLTTYIDQDIPVAIWGTIEMMEPETGTSWYIPEKDEWFTWIRHEHCLVLVGYDAEVYYFLDPYNGKGFCSYPRELVEKRYEQLGRQAVVCFR